MDEQKKQRKARWLSLCFVGLVAVILVGMLGYVALTPYDSGILAGAALSGNNQQGGTVVASNDYLFYTANDAIMRMDRGTGETLPIYRSGQVSHLNPFDGWLYFVEQGKIMRIAYYGDMKLQMGTADNVTMMSVNGSWIYYLTEDGVLGKVRTDNKLSSTLTDGSIPFTAFEAANRIILATDGKAIYRMKTDGSECSVLAEGTAITRMLYTLDDLYYCDNGQVIQIQSVEAGRDDGVGYEGLSARLFNYNVNNEGRGQIFYTNDKGEIRVRKLMSVEHKEEEDRLLYQAKDIADLYSIDADLYYHDSKGQLFLVRINDVEVTVNPVK